MGGGNVGFRFGAGGQQGCADIVEARVALKEPPRHLRLTVVLRASTGGALC